ncbi:MAG: hypothetical protein R2727_12315 [Bacteroidales bacterium]
MSLIEVSFREKLKSLGERGIAILSENNVTDDLLYKKSNSIIRFF